MRTHDVIKKPIITEKALASAQQGTYVFQVHRKANKHQIKQAIEELFDVEVAGVRTQIRRGKVKRVGRRMQSKKRPDIKLAIVTLSKGSIDIVPKA